jgi:hypothetical protein
MPFAIIAAPVLLCLLLGIISGLRAERKLRR